MNTDWNNLFKVRIANPDDSFQKHEIVKLLIVMKILNKYKKRKWIRIYTEFRLNGLKPDVWFENIKNKSIIAYEIQKAYTNSWVEKKEKEYNNYSVENFTLDFIPINIRKLSDDISKLNKELDEYIF